MRDRSQIKIVFADDIRFDDFEKLHALLVSAFAYMDDRIDPPSSLHRQDAQSLRVKAQREKLVLAIDGTELVGCLFLRPDTEAFTESYYIGKLAVRGDCRGEGIGKKLIDKATVFALDNNCNLLTLETRVELLENHRYFERLGFTRCGENSHSGYDRPTSFFFQKQI